MGTKRRYCSAKCRNRHGKHTPFMVDSAMQGQGWFCQSPVRPMSGRAKPALLWRLSICMPPGWDGVQTIKNLWREDPNLQVVICTARIRIIPGSRLSRNWG